MTSLGSSLSHNDGYTCGICNQKFHHPSLVYSCNNSHIFCQKCYRCQYYKEKGPLCPHRCCKSYIYRMDKQTENLQKLGKKMFPNPEKISEEISRKNYSVFHDYTTAISSKKPVNCPFPGCKKTIAVTAFDAHFKYEHKFVASISISYGTRNGLEFNPYDLKNNQKVCIILIKILDGSLKTEPSPLDYKTQNLTTKPVMLLMVTRIPFYNLNPKSDNIDEEEFSDEYESYNCYPFDKIIFWIASNIPTRSKYTLAISTPCKAIRLKYFGPILPVSEDGVKLCEDGKGLILGHTHLIGMTDNGKKSLTFDIVLHNFEGDDCSKIN